MLKCLRSRVLSEFSLKVKEKNCKCVTSLPVFSGVEDKVINQFLAIREHCTVAVFEFYYSI